MYSEDVYKSYNLVLNLKCKHFCNLKWLSQRETGDFTSFPFFIISSKANNFPI